MATLQIYEDFEDSTYAVTFSGDAWTRDLSSYAGLYAYKSMAISNSQTTYSQFSFTVPSSAINASLSLYYRVSSELNFDFLTIYLNGTSVVHVSGAGNWTNYTVSLVAGTTYTVKFEYKTDSSNLMYSNCGWIDEIKVFWDIPVQNYTYSSNDNLSLVDADSELINKPSNNEALSLVDVITNKFLYFGFGIAKFDTGKFDDNKIPVSLADTLTLTDNIMTTYKLSIGEALGVADSFYRLISAVQSDVLSMTDSVMPQCFIQFVESVALTDSIYSLIQTVLGDSLTLTEVLNNNTMLSKADTLSLLDADSELVQPLVVDTIALADGIASVVGLYKSEMLALADSINAYAQTNLADVLSLLDDIAKYFIDGANNDALAVADTLYNMMQQGANAEALVLADGVTVNYNDNNSENIPNADSIVNNVGKLVTDLVSTLDVISANMQDVNGDSSSASDSIGLTVKKTFNDLISLADAIAECPDLMRPMFAYFDASYFDNTEFDGDGGEELGLQDSFSYLKQLGVVANDTLSLVDSLNKNAQPLLADATSMSESTGINTNKPIDEASLGVVDTNSKSMTTLLAEMLGLSESLANSMITGAFDSIGLGDSYFNTPKPSIPEILGLADGITEADAYKLLSEIVSMLDNTSIADNEGAVNEAQSVVDSIITALTMGKNVDDIMSLLDDLRNTFGKFATEIISLSDAYNFSVNSAKAEVVSILEQLGISVTKPLPVDLVGVLDEAMIKSALGIQAESTGVYDSIEGRKFIMLQQVFIEGVQVPVTGLKIQHTVKERVSTCSFNINSPSIDVLKLAKQRAEVRVYLADGDGSVDYFGGRIVNNPINAKTSISSEMQITVDDWSSVANDILVMEHYSSSQGTLTDIIKLMWEKYYPYDINLDSVIASTKQLDSISFNYATLFDATDQIAQLLGWTWYVDWNGAERVLQFFPPSVAIKPVTLSVENQNIVSGTAKFGQDTKLVNSVYVFGGDGLSNPSTETFLADGQRMAYSIGSRPDKVAVEYGITVTVNGVVQSMGFANADDETKFDVLVDYDNKVVIWRADNRPPLNAIIGMTYQYTYPILVHLTDDNSIKQFGLSEYRMQDSNIQTVQNAREKGRAYLRDNAYPVGYGECEVYVEGLRAGDFITVNLPKYNTFGMYEILEIEKWISVGKVRRRVTLNVSDDASSRIAQRLKEFSQRLASLEADQRPEDMIVQRILKQTRNLGMTSNANIVGNVSYTVGDALTSINYLEQFVAMLRSTSSITGLAKDGIPFTDSNSKKISPVKADSMVMHEHVAFSTSFFDRSKFGSCIFGGEVWS